MNEFEPELLIPLFAIVFGISIPLVKMYFDYKKKQNTNELLAEALKSGADVESIREMMEIQPSEPKAKVHQPYRAGLICLGIGGAMLVIGETTNDISGKGIAVPGILLAFLGVALLLADLINRKRMDKD
ncbi:MAG: hypothetical protein ACI81F_001980 [Thalassolituus oleivorans]|jgi:hypothetical protein